VCDGHNQDQTPYGEKATPGDERIPDIAVTGQGSLDLLFSKGNGSFTRKVVSLPESRSDDPERLVGDVTDERNGDNGNLCDFAFHVHRWIAGGGRDGFGGRVDEIHVHDKRHAAAHARLVEA
jgi:hypothetical protein